MGRNYFKEILKTNDQEEIVRRMDQSKIEGTHPITEQQEAIVCLKLKGLPYTRIAEKIGTTDLESRLQFIRALKTIVINEQAMEQPDHIYNLKVPIHLLNALLGNFIIRISELEERMNTGQNIREIGETKKKQLKEAIHYYRGGQV